MDWLFRADHALAPTNIPAVILSLLIAFLGQTHIAPNI